MSISKLVNSIDNLIELHEQLLKCSADKTKILVDGEMEALEKNIILESQIKQKIEREETNRLKQTKELIDALKIPTKKSNISTLLPFIKEQSKKEKLQKQREKLLEIIYELKNQEAMNKQLLMQSLQFIQMSLSTISPTLNNMNYNNKNNHTSERYYRSMYDSEV